MEPKRPQHLSELAELCLRAIAEAGLGSTLSLGGALGLLHYLDYRLTHDVDAWWTQTATTQERERVLDAVEGALRPHGEIRRRSWGDVVSIDLLREGKAVFNFQIAERSAQLEPTIEVPWIQVRLDSLEDLLASKMVALVERGAPRDFRDIHATCAAGLSTPERCWSLWRRRQEMAESDADSHRARIAVETHLERIARHRPLENVADAGEKERSAAVRDWFKGEFLDALRD